MRLADFDYELPSDRIAQAPIEPRDAARLLVDRGPAEAPAHHHVRDLPSLLQPGDLVVVNDTKVIPARLPLERRSGGRAEVLLLEPLDDTMREWEALVRPGRKVKVGERLVAHHDPSTELVEVRGHHGDGTRVVRLLPEDEPLHLLQRVGEMPLPPYITRRLDDPERYQTVYAARPASAAAPTAGLHLTPEVFGGLQAHGIDVARVELVVGLDTFKPVAEDDPTTHVMHSEAYHVDAQVLERCRRARAHGHRVVAIGTTSVRALESAARGPLSGRTQLFIHRPFDWQLVDVLLTNFHLPRTTLLLMIDAFVGPRWRDLYATALADPGYRFLSFGDAMLLQRATSSETTP